MAKPKSRREFLSAAAKAVAVLGAPAIVAARTTGPNRFDETVIGEDDYQFKVNHRWARLPDKYHWQTTHNVAVDSENNLYVIHEGRRELKDHPAIFVFDADGKFIRAFGSQFQGGGHGIEVRREGSEEFLYVAAYQQVKAIAKMTLAGETVWFRKAPMESGLYAAGENTSTEPTWTRQGFLPTNFAFLDDGGFLLADGYGSYNIHRYDRDANWVSCFGGPGDGKGKFDTAHGIWIDDRAGRVPSIVVTDRAHHTLQYFTMDGDYIETLSGYRLPANFDIRDNLLLVAELGSRITLLNEKNEVVARLGGQPAGFKVVKNLRSKPDQWQDGVFVHPHDACFDSEGNVFVAEWVQTGRLTKLTRLT